MGLTIIIVSIHMLLIADKNSAPQVISVVNDGRYTTTTYSIPSQPIVSNIDYLIIITGFIFFIYSIYRFFKKVIMNDPNGYVD
jgi:hypothetical protein